MAVKDPTTARIPISVRTRFEVFKRDDFVCQYCGRRSPDVVLEVDHIVPFADGGTNDQINLTTACWECNSGKSDVPLGMVMTGEDPHDRAVLMLERERQLCEYNRVVAEERQRREQDVWDLIAYWREEQGIPRESDGTVRCSKPDYRWLFNALEWCPREEIRRFMDLALARGMTKNLRYVAACARNWRYEQTAAKDMQGAGGDY